MEGSVTWLEILGITVDSRSMQPLYRSTIYKIYMYKACYMHGKEKSSV